MAQEWGDDTTSSTRAQKPRRWQKRRKWTGQLKARPESCTDDFKFSRQDPGKLDENVKRFPPIAFEMFAGSCKLSKCLKSHGFAALGIDHNRH